MASETQAQAIKRLARIVEEMETMGAQDMGFFPYPLAEKFHTATTMLASLCSRKNCKWKNPQEWLLDHAGKICDNLINRPQDLTEVWQIIEALAYRLDGESIQDLFHDEMEQDGYFRK